MGLDEVASSSQPSPGGSSRGPGRRAACRWRREVPSGSDRDPDERPSQLSCAGSRRGGGRQIWARVLSDVEGEPVPATRGATRSVIRRPRVSAVACRTPLHHQVAYPPPSAGLTPADFRPARERILHGGGGRSSPAAGLGAEGRTWTSTSRANWIAQLCAVHSSPRPRPGMNRRPGASEPGARRVRSGHSGLRAWSPASPKLLQFSDLGMRSALSA